MAREYATENWVDWCPGCGNFGILSSMYKALNETDLHPETTVIVSGIGCSGKIPHYIDVNGVHTIHGRAIPFASGIKIANPPLNVIVNGGDGDLLGIGAGHFVALGRRNLDMVVLMHDNRVYGLTKGQASPTLSRGKRPKALSTPTIQDAVPALPLALTAGYTFVARGYALSAAHLQKLIIEGIQHDGAAFIDILQPCVTYNNIHTSAFYQQRIEELADDWDPTVKDDEERVEKKYQAMNKLSENKKIPIGIFYKDTITPSFEKRIENKMPGYLNNPPAMQKIEKENKSVLSQNEFNEIFSEYIVAVERH